ncbi:sensor histidine kinase [Thalassotalea euphylliae]|uniref:sensor histidine kinase n=1 Tax=Thalassotalea euphylliae TaxID=1655234 RepID=UPI0036393552
MNNVIKTPIFKSVVVTGTLVTLAIVALISGYSAWRFSEIEADVKAEIIEFKEEVVGIYEEDGVRGLVEEFHIDELDIWPREETESHFHEDELLFSLRNSSGELIAGSQLPLTLNTEWQMFTYPLEDEEIVVYSHHFMLGNDLGVSLTRGQAHEHYELLEWLYSLSIGLLIFLPPSILLISYFASRRFLTEVKQLSDEVSTLKSDKSLKTLDISNKGDSLSPLRLAINELIGKMSALHQDIETMSVGIAHDLKTPLSRVANRLQLMQQDIDNKDMTQQHIDRAVEQLDVVISTFSNIVRLSEIESGRRKQQFVSLNLSALITDMAENYSPVFDDTGRTLDVSVVSNVSAKGDADLLNQMLSNLLENALEYSESNATVWVRLQSHTSGVLLQIGDSGPGIPASDHIKVFSRFYRGDISRNKPGNGLGLSIVKAICDLHDADIQLIPNQSGAVFNIVIPTA